jgi:hypothetical protein
MTREGNPFAILDKQSVIGTLRDTGSHDPDVLDARKAALIARVKLPKLAGVVVILLGGVVSRTVVGAFVGIPMVLAGGWLWRRAARNAATIEAGFIEYVNFPGW